MKTSKLHFFWKDPQVRLRFKSAVSIHSHTAHSRESLNMVPDYARSNLLFGIAIRAFSNRYREAAGIDLDFSKPYFTPPLSASAAFQVEAGQIERKLGLTAFVSLTDHDTMAAPLLLRSFMNGDRVPISLEWTVPFENTYFHLGVHNIQAGVAATILGELNQIRCTHCRLEKVSCRGQHEMDCGSTLRSLFEWLNSFPETLIVLNHPLWDTCGLGTANHRRNLTSFLFQYSHYIHAFEINGLRTWAENVGVLQMAEQWRMPAISGGDRHGCEPNAILNLTDASNFSEFVSELRHDAVSDLVFMDQYREPLNLRKLQTAWDILRDLPNDSGGVDRWVDRVFVPWPDRGVVPLSTYWKEGEPAALKRLLYLIRLGENRSLRPVLRCVL